MSRTGGLLAAVLGAAGTVAACGSPVPASPSGSPSPLVDALAIGPDRETSTTLFHHLETAARDAWHKDHPHSPVSGFSLHHAGVLADGTVQAGTDGLLTFLVVIDVPGDGQHALVLNCSPLAVTDISGCEPGVPR